jgi:uncharacterized protein (DUF1778 family)
MLTPRVRLPRSLPAIRISKEVDELLRFAAKFHKVELSDYVRHALANQLALDKIATLRAANVPHRQASEITKESGDSTK